MMRMTFLEKESLATEKMTMQLMMSDPQKASLISATLKEIMASSPIAVS